ncbi:MAG: type II secretion system F family protein [Candidatus Margulisbacteria bacterium]|jgi:tight adherence protein B|nr:type II secretion system F family protein [Candidatus Margulisiibacteriota bacterium]
MFILPYAMLVVSLFFIGFAVYGLAVNRQGSLRARLHNLQTIRETTGKPGRRKKTDKKNIYEKFLRENIRIFNKLYINIRPQEIILLDTVCAWAVFLLVYLLLKNIFSALLLGLSGIGLPYLVCLRLLKNKRKSFERLFGDALVLIANVLKSGFSLKQALQIVAEEMPPAVAEEFTVLNQEINFGLDLSEAMSNLAERIPNEHVRLFVTAVNIQNEVGGSMSEIIGKISETIQKKQEMQGDLKALTSQGKTSGFIVGLLPFGICGMIFLMNPDYMRPLFSTPVGMMMIAAAVVLEIMAALTIKAIITVE